MFAVVIRGVADARPMATLAVAASPAPTAAEEYDGTPHGRTEEEKKIEIGRSLTQSMGVGGSQNAEGRELKHTGWILQSGL